MPTHMHRLQISLPEWQTDFLAALARRHGISMAEMVRRLIEREAEAARQSMATSSVWEIAGIADDPGPLIDGVPVSEKPELYLLPPGADIRPLAGASARSPALNPEAERWGSRGR